MATKNDQITAFRIYANDLLLDIDHFYDDFVEDFSELMQSLQSGKVGWIQAMIERAETYGMTLPKIIRSHWQKPFMIEYAEHNHPEMLKHAILISKGIGEFDKFRYNLHKDPYKVDAVNLEQLNYILVDIYNNVCDLRLKLQMMFPSS